MYRELGRKQSKQAKQGGLEGEAAVCQQQQGQENTDKQTATANSKQQQCVCVCFSLGQFCVIAKMAIIHRKI
jgi:hypothetical protein